jgi:hypothetical protein
MPIGGFLDSLPTMLFIVAHVLFLVVGVWALRRSAQAGLPFSSALWLYIISQVGFLAVFGGVLTLKMGVLIEQTLILIFVVMLVRPVSARAQART